MKFDDRKVKVIKFANNPNTKNHLSESLRDLIQADKDWDTYEDREVPENLYTKIEKSVLKDLDKLSHPYHNKQHTQNVISRAMELAESAQLGSKDKQLLRIAALFHDYDHAGNTFRQSVEGCERNDISNEEFAAIKADEIVGNLLSPCQRLSLQGMILATSFAQNNPDMLPDYSYQRDYKPIEKLEKFLAFSDINNLEDSLEDWMAQNYAILQESGRGGIADNFDKYLEGKLSFLSYVQMKLDDVKPFISSDAVSKLQNSLNKRIDQIKIIKESGSELGQKYAASFSQIREKRLAELEG